MSSENLKALLKAASDIIQERGIEQIPVFFEKWHREVVPTFSADTPWTDPRVEIPFTKEILYCGTKCTVACDLKCHKAWGVQHRPKIQVSEDEDDVIFLSDGQLGHAPADPRTYEGGEGKPVGAAYRMNKWCVRECERAVIVSQGQPVTLIQWENPRANIQRRCPVCFQLNCKETHRK